MSVESATRAPSASRSRPLPARLARRLPPLARAARRPVALHRHLLDAGPVRLAQRRHALLPQSSTPQGGQARGRQRPSCRPSSSWMEVSSAGGSEPPSASAAARQRHLYGRGALGWLPIPPHTPCICTLPKNRLAAALQGGRSGAASREPPSAAASSWSKTQTDPRRHCKCAGCAGLARAPPPSRRWWAGGSSARTSRSGGGGGGGAEGRARAGRIACLPPWSSWHAAIAAMKIAPTISE